MDSLLTPLWTKVVDKLGSLSSLIPAIADQLKVKFTAADVDGVTARLNELDEVFAQGHLLTAKVRDAMADGALTATEGADVLLALEKFVDELEDVVTGVDEDDVPEVTPV